MSRRPVVAGVLLALVGPALTACSGLPGLGGDGYCDAVRSHQRELGEAVARGGQASLLSVLPALEDLRSKAPADVGDEWQQVVGRLEALDSALRAAGVDPAGYDAAKPPTGLTAAQRDAITAAATELARPETADALAAVQQQVRDVCQTSLTG
ncbi:hypothetical protein K8Z61_05020 [Nocardioides sp. TRM66260-LWL]|uniref:hypothetical protein n=1 Tax=Nocardioides sp. TRM66260-LWL TaxID=2874478 RepID=UPI001CC5ACDB|nr:hypothetical protein [Nocardioides sp. TRM66260-LWL]MBZ5733849.1 hypothetical protein [Nocardioides sp. TRM66260-LWL]